MNRTRWTTTLALVLIYLVLWSFGASAQTPNPVTPGYQICNTNDPGVTKCSFQPVDSTHGLPVTNSGTQVVSGAVTVTSGAITVGSYPTGATAVTNSGTGSTGAVVATLPAVSAKTTFICGFVVSSSGATTPTAVNVTVANTISGTMNFVYSVVGVATDNQVPLTVPIFPCVPASAVNTTIVVTQPGVGAGATAAATTAWGYQQ